jgi:hypothetical protein
VACRRAWPLALLSASSVLAACGGHAQRSAPHLPKNDAAQLIALAQAVARDARTDGCAARTEIDALSAQARELVAAGRVPLRLRGPLLKGVDDLAADAPACTPPPKPATKPHPKHEKPPKGHKDHHHEHD